MLFERCVDDSPNIFRLGNIGAKGQAIQFVDRGIDVAPNDLAARCGEASREGLAEPFGSARNHRNLSVH